MTSLITVFTPTYNRAYILNKLYESLCRQKDKNFEWVIVDDGSTDHTRELVESWMSERIIDIVYRYKINGGKHTAHNLGVTIAKGDLFLICDSDDYMVDDAICSVREKWKAYENDSIVAGIVAYRGGTEGDTLCNKKFPDVDRARLNDLFKVSGLFDTTQIYRTSVLKEFPFPEYKDEKFFPENWCWGSIDLSGKEVAVMPKILEICEYREDGLSANKSHTTDLQKNPHAYLDYSFVMSKLVKGLAAYKWYGKYMYLNNMLHIKNRLSIRCVISLPFYWGHLLKNKGNVGRTQT